MIHIVLLISGRDPVFISCCATGMDISDGVATSRGPLFANYGLIFLEHGLYCGGLTFIPYNTGVW